MHSMAHDQLSPQVRRSLARFGADLSLARRRRRLSVAMMTERVGVSKATLQRMERGDPTVAAGIYAQALFVLGLGTPLDDLADQGRDERGLLLDRERVPQRIRARKHRS